jgi:DNA-directed RNA polymerase specialized sigma24 family protein
MRPTWPTTPSCGCHDRPQPIAHPEPRSYLSAIAQALLIDKVRRRTIEQAYLQALALRPEPVEVSPEIRLSIIEMLVAVDALLDRLGPQGPRYLRGATGRADLRGGR